MTPPPQHPPRWSDEQFEADRAVSEAAFRAARMQEPLEEYLERFDVTRAAVENLIETTVDLSQFRARAVEVLSDAAMLVAARYLASPAMSADDVKTLAEASLAPSRLQRDPEMAARVADTILLGLDRNRFPWISEDREPTEHERETAVVATTAMIASRQVMTARAHESKDEQEEAVKARLRAADLTEVPSRNITNLSQAPEHGEFCGESMCGTRKADIVVRLFDGRLMPIECKVSNSSTNSVKRLNNDAAVKALRWLDEFGTTLVVPTAVLAGVFKLHNLRAAQDQGLTIYWAHSLDPLISFVLASKTHQPHTPRVAPTPRLAGRAAEDSPGPLPHLRPPQDSQDL